MSEECAHSYANKIGCPECGELTRKPCACPGCENLRKGTTFFCERHQHSDSRLHFIAKTPSPTNEQLAFMMQRDGEQQ